MVDSSSAVLRNFNLPDMGTQHPIITQVDRSSPAGKARLKVGDLIFKVNGKKINKMQQLKKLIRKKGVNELHILRYHHLYDQYLVFSVKLRK